MAELKTIGSILGGCLALVGVLILTFLLFWRGVVALNLNPIDKHETRFEIGFDSDTHTIQFKKVEEKKTTFKGAEE